MVTQEPRDCFISHASEDKDAVARPLAESLTNAGYSVWFDEYELVLGDSLRANKDPGTWVAASVVGTLENEAKLSQESEANVVELQSHPSAHVRASADRVLAGRETSG